MIRRRQFPVLLSAAATSRTATAQTAKFPSARVTIVVPFRAGAATDISARIYAERFAAFTASEKDRWGRIIHRANIKLK